MTSTVAYYSSARCVVETIDRGLIDVSPDIQSVSVNRTMDAASTASVTLLNYTKYSGQWVKIGDTGRYNDVIHVGDRCCIWFIKNGTVIQAFTGRVSKAPVAMFNESAYTFTAADCIQDLQYIYWDPYSAEAQAQYTMSTANVMLKAGDADSGIGEMLTHFLSDKDGVCHFPKSAVKIYKFPKLTDNIKNIIDACSADVKDASDDLYKEYTEQMYNLLFGGPEYASGSESGVTDESFGDKDAGTSNGVSKGLVTYGTSDNAAHAVKMLVNKEDYKHHGTDVMMKSSDGRWKNWDYIDASSHGGAYGLTRGQMKKHAKIDKMAYACSKTEQDRAIKALFDTMKHDSNKQFDVPAAVFYYFIGSPFKVKQNGDIDWSRCTAKGIKFGGKAIVKGEDWTDIICTLTGLARTKTSAKKKSPVKNASKAPAPAKNAKTNEYAAKFGEWVKQHTGVRNLSDTMTNQCWELWHVYYNTFLGLSPSGWALQPSGGNQAYWNSFPQNSYLGDNFQKLGPGERWQAGDVFFTKNGGEFDASYGHTGIVLSDDGTTVTTFDQGATMLAGQHKYAKSGFAGVIRPKLLGGVPGDTSGVGGSSSSSGSSTVQSEANKQARNEAMKLFKFVNFYNPEKSIESQLLGSWSGSPSTGLYLANDVPALDYVKTCCHASLRSFMSAPDGSFAAFVPDWFALLDPSNAAKSTLTIPAVETIKFHADIDKSSYVSHYFLTTEESAQGANAYGTLTNGSAGLSGVYAYMTSHGTITMQHQAEALQKLMDISATGCDTLEELMQRWGISVKTEHNEYIQDPRLTSLYALYQFLKYWANCFKTSVQITFRPEVIPGIRLLFPSAGNVSLYVSSVTHTWSASNGGRTSVTVNSPYTGDRSGIAGN